VALRSLLMQVAVERPDGTGGGTCPKSDVSKTNPHISKGVVT